MDDLKVFRDAFYASKEKLIQDAFLLKYCTATQCVRRRPKNKTHQNKQYQIHCYIRDQSKNYILVCQAAFLEILGIFKHRLNHVMKVFFKTGKALTEKRGGDKKSSLFSDKKNAIMKLINKLKCIEAHYCRSESSRMYLSSDLNIRKLYKLYSDQTTEAEKVKESYFRHIFNSKYNLSFSSPRTDVCSTCLEYCEKIKRAVDEQSKEQFQMEKKIHKARAATFFQLLKEKRKN